MDKIRAIIVDDEPKAGKLLGLLIEEVDRDIDIAEIYTDPAQALQEIDSMSVDVIFLDIDMPGMTGFDFLGKLGSTDHMIVFVTGYDQYAVRAMQMAAVGYIMKPVDTSELETAINQVRRRLRLYQQRDENKILLENLAAQNLMRRKIGIPSSDGIDFVTVEDIVYCEGADKYTLVKLCTDEKLLSSYNIGEFVKIIGESGFYQVHKSYLVNLSKIRQYHKEGILMMENGDSIPVARRRKDDFLKIMKTLNR